MSQWRRQVEVEVSIYSKSNFFIACRSNLDAIIIQLFRKPLPWCPFQVTYRACNGESAAAADFRHRDTRPQPLTDGWLP